MKTIKHWFADPKVRLAARALLAGLLVAYSHLKGGHITHGVLVAALVAGGWAAVELFTPANGVLGLFRQAVKVDPALAPYAPPAAVAAAPEPPAPPAAA